ncbi:predicted protein [Nematostella vectensis]|uniref:Receptor for retinol uptake STRA6 n=1 Tax=Nematostella vectensis TaxID=45351 RepID=A7RS29_NEMVE|nr:predicted protein [Nematostella vectensis]|eukprot:XP_001637738.1 predicted protein [Nematostella vectensis]
MVIFTMRRALIWRLRQRRHGHFYYEKGIDMATLNLQAGPPEIRDSCGIHRNPETPDSRLAGYNLSWYLFPQIYPGDLLAIDFPTHICLLILTIHFLYYVILELVKRYRKARTITSNEAQLIMRYRKARTITSNVAQLIMRYRKARTITSNEAQLIMRYRKAQTITSNEAQLIMRYRKARTITSNEALWRQINWKPERNFEVSHIQVETSWREEAGWYLQSLPSPDFKYSTRIACTYTVGLLAVYEIACAFVVLGGIFYKYSLNYLADNPKILEDLGLTDYAADYEKYLEICFVAWYVALGLTCVKCVVLVANMLTWYRTHVMCLQKGDKSFLPADTLKKTPSNMTLAGLKYSGYQVAYIAWAFVIAHFVIFLVLAILGIEFIQPIVDGSMDSLVWAQVLKIWPAIFVSLMIILIQFLLAKFVFLIDNGSYLALDNRRLFHICTYFLFFFNIFLGLASCLLRIIIGSALGIVFLARTQKSVISRDYEDRDPGFHAYVGYLYLEHTHSNPVLVTFSRLLVMSLRQKDWDERAAHESQEHQDIELDEEKQLSRRRARIRWSLAVTLINNPNLCELRKRDKSPEKAPVRDLKVLVKGFEERNGAAYYNKTFDELENEEHGSTMVESVTQF